MSNAQIITCVCGNAFAGCIEPDCYMDEPWMKKIVKYVSKGCTVEVMPVNDITFKPCTCPPTIKIEKEDDVDSSQTELF